MKKLSFFPALVVLSFLYFNADAQHSADTAKATGSGVKVAIGIRGGISIPNLSAGGSDNNPLNTGYSSRSGPDAGIFAEFKFSDLFSLQPMVEYSAQGGKKDGLQAFPTPAALAAGFQAEGQPAPTYLYANADNTSKINYMLIPILAKFGWNLGSSPFRVYVDAGPFAGILLSATQVISNSGGFFIQETSNGKVTYVPLSQFSPEAPSNINSSNNIKSDLHPVNVGFEGNVGFAYKFFNASHKTTGYIFIEGGGDYGFLNIQKGTANGKNNIGAGTASIGYAYCFN